MKVLYFHQHFTTPDGAGGTRSYEFARALIQRGHRVTMVCGRHDRSALALPWDAKERWFRGEIDGIDVIALPLNYSNSDGLLRRTQVFLRFAFLSIRIAFRERHDVLFATSTPLTAALPGIVLKLFRPRSRFVFEVRDLWPELPKALGLRNPILLGGMSLLEWLAYWTADACIGLAPGIVEGIKRRGPRGLPVAMIPNGCDLDLFTPAKRAALNVPGVAPGDFVAGFTGAHGVANGLDAVLDAAAELKRRGRKDIKLVLIGDGKCKPALVDRAQRESLDNCVFLPLVRKTEIARVTTSFDCGLQILANVPAFYFGTSPNKFFDYLSSGVPVLVNYPGWMAELVRRHACGVAVPPGDAAAFAEALCAMADRPPLRFELGREGRKLAEDMFARSQLAGQFCMFLERAYSHALSE
jgi:glycosyltransferase involved in cell wall biosynthesis